MRAGSNWFGWLLSWALLLGWVGVAYADQKPETKIALVIGNSHYERDTMVLPNAATDAQDIAGALTKDGFNVLLKIDLNQRDFGRALAEFDQESGNYDIALVYYAGHGVQYRGENFLLPTDNIPKVNQDIQYNSVPISQVLRAASNASRAKIIILDACRNSIMDHAKPGSRAVTGVGDRSGLAAIEGQDGLVVFFSAAPGKTAFDSVGGKRNSPFAEAMLKHLGEPGRELRDMFIEVKADVKAVTYTSQEPEAVSDLLSEHIFLNPEETAEEAYQKIKGSSDTDALKHFIERFPDTSQADAVQNKLDVLDARRRLQEEQDEEKKRAAAAEDERKRQQTQQGQREEAERLQKQKEEAGNAAHDKELVEQRAQKAAEDELRARVAGQIELARQRQLAFEDEAKRQAAAEAQRKADEAAKAEEDAKRKAEQALQAEAEARHAAEQAAEAKRLADQQEAARRDATQRETDRKQQEARDAAEAAQRDIEQKQKDSQAAAEAAQRDTAQKELEAREAAETAGKLKEASARAKADQEEAEEQARAAEVARADAERQRLEKVKADACTKDLAQLDTYKKSKQIDLIQSLGDQTICPSYGEAAAKAVKDINDLLAKACDAEQKTLNKVDAHNEDALKAALGGFACDPIRKQTEEKIAKIEQDKANSAKACSDERVALNAIDPGVRSARDDYLALRSKAVCVDTPKAIDDLVSKLDDRVYAAQVELVRLGCLDKTSRQFDDSTVGALTDYMSARNAPASSPKINDGLVAELSGQVVKFCAAKYEVAGTAHGPGQLPKDRVPTENGPAPGAHPVEPVANAAGANVVPNAVAPHRVLAAPSKPKLTNSIAQIPVAAKSAGSMSHSVAPAAPHAAAPAQAAPPVGISF